jgi:hypothetical protein
VYSGNGYAEFNTTGAKVLSNVAWLISPKIDMDTHTNEILTFRTAQHHLDVDSPLNSLSICFYFDGLNVTKATWIPLKVILPKQATPWYQFVGSGGVDLSSYREKSISLLGTPARKKPCFGWSFSGRRCAGFGK